MSLSNPTLQNPAKHFFQWGGKAGQLTWYDKEKKENIPVKLPFEFIVLDELSTISGYSQPLQTGFWSNEVRNTKKEELFVRTAKGPFESGLYENLTETRSKGGKYTKTVYLAHRVGQEWIIGCLKLPVSSALSAWIEFTKFNRVDQGKVQMTKGEQQESQMGPYFPPVYKLVPWKHEEFETAVKLDQELQKYLNTYLAAKQVDEDGFSQEIYEDVGKATPEQQADFERRKAEVKNAFGGEYGEEPINLDDIPY